MKLEDKVASKMKGPNIIVQLQNAEQNIEQLYKVCNANFSKTEAKLSEHQEIVEALIGILGIQQVFEKIKSNRIEKAEKLSELKRIALEESVKNGSVVVADEVAENSIIVGSEVDKDGNLCPPARAQLLWAEIDDNLAKPLLGKKVGDVITSPMETQFTIKEIYNMVLPTPTTEAPVEVAPELPPEVSPPELPEAPTVSVASNGSVN